MLPSSYPRKPLCGHAVPLLLGKCPEVDSAGRMVSIRLTLACWHAVFQSHQTEATCYPVGAGFTGVSGCTHAPARVHLCMHVGVHPVCVHTLGCARVCVCTASVCVCVCAHTWRSASGACACMYLHVRPCAPGVCMSTHAGHAPAHRAGQNMRPRASRCACKRGHLQVLERAPSPLTRHWL